MRTASARTSVCIHASGATIIVAPRRMARVSLVVTDGSETAVARMTPEQADELADALREQASRAREEGT